VTQENGPDKARDQRPAGKTTSPDTLVPEMTDVVSSGMLNPTRSHSHSPDTQDQKLSVRRVNGGVHPDRVIQALLA